MPPKPRAHYWRTFVFQKDLVAAVRAVVDTASDDTPFTSELISDLIVERHYYCKRHGLRPTQFKRTAEDQPYRFYGEFPRLGWHPISWRKCAQPPPTRETIIRDALRQSTEADKTAFRRAHPLCQHCGRAPSVETHHAEPTFAALVAAVFATVTEADLESALDTWNFFNPQPFTLPADHVIQRRFDERHQRARLEALCRNCHNATKTAK
jgi:5-methylcytosine-specific restriction endonuclease McrA